MDRNSSPVRDYMLNRNKDRTYLYFFYLLALSCKVPTLNQAGDGYSDAFRQTVLFRCIIGETCRFPSLNATGDGQGTTEQSSSTSLPTIVSLSSSSGVEDDSLTISGTNFSTNASENVVTFSGGVSATATSSSQTSLTVTVPVGAKSGTIAVRTNIGSVTSSTSYTVYRYFVYVPAGTSMEIYKLNLTNGNLTAVSGSPFANIPLGFFHPTGKFMYASTGVGGANNVRRYTIDGTTGIISTSNITFGTADNYPTYFDFHPSGKFLYAPNYNTGNVSAFSIDSSTGDLTKINDFGSSCGCLNQSQIKITPDGKYLYVSVNVTDGIAQFSINQTTGALTIIGTLALASTGIDGILVNPASTSVFAIAASTNQVISTSINQATGGLSTFGNYASATGNLRGAMHPSGNFLYTVNITSVPRVLAKWNVASDGSLSGLTTLGFGSNLQYVNIDPTGRYAFVNNGGTNNFYEISIDQTTGDPTLLNGGAPFVTSGTPGLIFPIRIPQ